MKKFWCKVAKVGTLGIVNINPQANTVIIKDPITSIGNSLAKLKDSIVHDFSLGVWIGKRPMKGIGVGISSYAT